MWALSPSSPQPFICGEGDLGFQTRIKLLPRSEKQICPTNQYADVLPYFIGQVSARFEKSQTLIFVGFLKSGTQQSEMSNFSWNASFYKFGLFRLTHHTCDLVEQKCPLKCMTSHFEL